MKELLPYIIHSIEKSKGRYEIHSFDSGAKMIDIWIGNKFYVIHIYGDEIGLSLIDEKTLPFDTIPDRSFKIFSEFKTEFEKIFL